MADVFVERTGSDTAGAVRRLLDRVELPDLRSKTVLLKPNMGRMAGAATGVVATPAVILAAARWFLDRGVGRLLLGDSPITGVKSAEAFTSAGLAPESLPKGVTFIDLDHDKPVSVSVPAGRLIRRTRVCAPVHAADFIVSIPVMKTHMHTVVSLGLKNMKGCLFRKEKVKYHQLEGKGDTDKSLDIAIADLATVLLPHLTFVDGSVGMEGFGPSTGTTVHPGLLVAGRDCIATDAVAATLMGFDPAAIPILRLCAERGLGTIDTKRITVHPDGWRDWRFPFKPAPCSLDYRYDGVAVYDAGACSACMATVLLFLERYAGEVRQIYGNEPVRIYIGDKNTVTDDPNAILVGRCTSADKGKGLFIQGCPPVASDILATIRARKRSRR
ncbi:MAG: DUF362 domain-containing protein [Planctomycetota bacterium]